LSRSLLAGYVAQLEADVDFAAVPWDDFERKVDAQGHLVVLGELIVDVPDT
jgi:hypothetical protein